MHNVFISYHHENDQAYKNKLIEYGKNFGVFIDNLVAPNAPISVVSWDRLSPENLKFLVDATFDGRSNCEYDLSRPMKRRNV